MGRFLSLVIAISLFFSGCVAQPQVNSLSQPLAGSVAVTVSSIEILRLATDPPQVQVKVTGSLPDDCSLLKEPAFEREGRLFLITLNAARIVGAACSTGEVVFSRIIPLPLGVDSSPVVGRFAVLVNGIQQIFEVQASSTQAPVVANEPAGQPPTVIAPVSITSTPEVPVTAAPEIITTQEAAATPATQSITLGSVAGPADCTNVAAFFEDVTIPSGTSLDPVTRFIKTWKVRNEGTCTWGQGYQLVFIGGTLMGASLSVPLPPAAPQEIVEVSVPMTTPDLPGLYRGEWGFLTPDGKAFGVGSASQVPLKVKVGVRQKPTEEVGCEYQVNAEEEQKIMAYINEERAKNGLPPHVVDEALSDVARAHSLERGCLGVHSHFGADGKNYETRVKRADIDYRWVNEIIYNGSSGAKWAVQWWVYKSKLHHDIVMSEKYSVVGIGYVKTNRGEYPDYFTVVLISPP